MRVCIDAFWRDTYSAIPKSATAFAIAAAHLGDGAFALIVMISDAFLSVLMETPDRRLGEKSFSVELNSETTFRDTSPSEKIFVMVSSVIGA